MRRILWLVLTAGIAACAAEPAPAPSASRLRVDLAIDPAGLRVANISPARGPRRVAGGGAMLEYELQRDGAVITRGSVPDPRRLRGESFGGGLQASEETVESGRLSVDLPAGEGELVLFARTGSGARREIGRVYVHPTLGRTAAPLLDDTDVLGDPVAIRQNASTAGAVDIVILPDGYTEAELPQFAEHARQLAESLYAHHDFGAHANKINTWYVNVRSRDSGIGAGKNTAFGLRPEGDRCVWFGDTREIDAAQELARRVPAEVIVMLANSELDAGCADGGGAPLLAMTRVNLGDDVLAHELGHALLGLADEYTDGTCDLSTATAPNISRSSTRRGVPWADLVATTTPMPTPAETRHQHTIGAFEGAYYCTRRVFRPQLTCLMRELGVNMCAVCRRVLDQYFARFSGEPVMEEAEEAPVESDPPSGGEDPTGASPGEEAPVECPESYYGDGIYCDADCPGGDPDCAAAEPEPEGPTYAAEDCTCPPGCDYCYCGTEQENACPDSYNGSSDGCDCGCQFSDLDCEAAAPPPPPPDEPLPCSCDDYCGYCWCGTTNESSCPESWNGTGDGCDCGCQFYDWDCG